MTERGEDVIVCTVSGVGGAFRGRFLPKEEQSRHSRESGNLGQRPTVVMEPPGCPPARA